jgi:hypothetical protein
MGVVLVGAIWLVINAWNIQLEIITKVIDFLLENKEVMAGIFVAIAVMIASILIPAFITWAAAAVTAAVTTIAAFLPFLLVGAAIAAIATLIFMAWNSNFLGIQGIVAGLVDFLVNVIIPGITNFINGAIAGIIWLKDNWAEAIGFVIGFFVTLPIKLPFLIASALTSIVKLILGVNWVSVFGGMLSAVIGLVGKILSAFGGLIVGITKLDWVGIGKAIVNTVIDLINGLIKGALAGLPGGGTIASKFKIPRLATGTDFFQGGTALVGEKGPELVTLPRGSEITPNNQLPKGDNFEINVNVGMYAGTETEKRRIGMEILDSINQVKVGKGLQPI